MPKAKIVFTCCALLGCLALLVAANATTPTAAAQGSTPTPTIESTGVTLVVTKLEDTNDGICDADCSLTEAINAAPSGGIVRFAEGLTGTIKLLGEFIIEKSLTIIGHPDNSIVMDGSHAGIDGSNVGTRFSIIRGGKLDLQYLTFVNSTRDNPFIIAFDSEVTIDHCVFRRIKKVLQIYRVSNLKVSRSLFEENEEVIHNLESFVFVSTSSFINNGSNTYASVLDNGAFLYVTTSLFYQNGDVLKNEGFAIIHQSTISDTQPYLTGSEVYTLQSRSGRVILRNTIIARSDGKPNCFTFNVFEDDDGNLQYPDAGCGETIPVADPQLGPLTAGEGTIRYLPLLPTSPALGAGDISHCSGAENNTDIRGWKIRSPHCDSGSYQSQASAPH